jgi:hypothetical protein
VKIETHGTGDWNRRDEERDMTASLVGLTRPARINQQTIAMLREWLEMSERGEIHGVVLAGLCADGETMSAGTENESISALLGALDILRYRILTRHFGDHQ